MSHRSSFRDSTYGEGGIDEEFNSPELIGEEGEVTGDDVIVLGGGTSPIPPPSLTPGGGVMNNSSTFFPSGPQTAATSFNGRQRPAHQPAMGNKGLESQRLRDAQEHLSQPRPK